MVESHLSGGARARWLLSGLVLLGAGPPGQTADVGGELAVGGNVAVTSDYIYHGVSESNGHLAVQADLHADIAGTFFGVWTSTRDRTLDPYAYYDLEAYVGHRFDLSSAWSTTVDVRSHYFIGGAQEDGSADYQQLTGSVSYFDRWTMSVGAIPNAVHYWYEERVGRSPAFFAEISGQWLLLEQGLFATFGAGYYRANPTGRGIGSGGGYAYGDAGLAFEHGRWRVDVGYFSAQREAQRLFPYPIPGDRFAGTLNWRF